MIDGINHNTPYIVIQEILRCNGSDIEIEEIEPNFNDIVKHIKEYQNDVEIEDDYDEETLNKISLFVSQEETNWDGKNLIKAFNSIVEYDNTIDQNFTIGPKTNDNPMSYDSIMLYSFCSENGINTSKEDSIEDLSIYVKLSFAKRNVLFDALSTKLCQADKYSLINILRNTKKNQKDYVFSENSIKVLKNLKNSDTERYLVTDEEAIFISFKQFSKDISQSSCPSRELIQLQKGESFCLDDNFCSKYKLNPIFYDVNRFWKSHLSNLYTEKNITTLLNNECVNHSDISDPKQFLYETTLTKGIYQGIIPGCRYNETYVLKTPFEELNPKYVISYGILNTNELIALTPEEIISFLNVHKDFRDFINEGEIMTERNIKKLILICKNFPHEKSFTDLLYTIRDIRLLGNVVNSKMKEFINYLKSSDQTTKENINKIFDKLFYVSMYMRGWDGKSEYPLQESKCKNYAERYDDIENVVLEKVRDINESINSLSDTTKIIIKSLPLIKISEKDKSYYRSTNYEEGLSFYERLMLISTNPDSIYACLRLSSNYLASTAQYYNALVNSKNYINIKQLEFIQ